MGISKSIASELLLWRWDRGQSRYADTRKREEETNRVEDQWSFIEHPFELLAIFIFCLEWNKRWIVVCRKLLAVVRGRWILPAKSATACSPSVVVDFLRLLPPARASSLMDLRSV